MKKVVFILFVILPFLLSGQNDTILFYGPNGKTGNVNNKVLKKEIKYRGKKRVRVRTFKANEETWQLLFTERITMKDPLTFNIRIKGKGFSEIVTRQFEELSESAIQFTDYSQGNIKRTGFTLTKIPLTLHGELTEFYPRGNKKTVSFYKNNQLLSNQNWSEDGQKYIDNVFYSVDREPRFLRGTHILHQHVMKTFNESNLDLSQLEGLMIVGFVVMENGEIDGIRIEQGIGQDLNNLALQAFSTLSGEWQPARLNGENVRFYQLFPINFIYQKVDFDYLEMRGSMLYWDIN